MTFIELKQWALGQLGKAGATPELTGGVNQCSDFNALLDVIKKAQQPSLSDTSGKKTVGISTKVFNVNLAKLEASLAQSMARLKLRSVDAIPMSDIVNAVCEIGMPLKAFAYLSRHQLPSQYLLVRQSQKLHLYLDACARKVKDTQLDSPLTQCLATIQTLAGLEHLKLAMQPGHWVHFYWAAPPSIAANADGGQGLVHRILTKMFKWASYLTCSGSSYSVILWCNNIFYNQVKRHSASFAASAMGAPVPAGAPQRAGPSNLSGFDIMLESHIVSSGVLQITCINFESYLYGWLPPMPIEPAAGVSVVGGRPVGTVAGDVGATGAGAQSLSDQVSSGSPSGWGQSVSVFIDCYSFLNRKKIFANAKDFGIGLFLKLFGGFYFDADIAPPRYDGAAPTGDLTFFKDSQDPRLCRFREVTQATPNAVNKETLCYTKILKPPANIKELSKMVSFEDDVGFYWVLQCGELVLCGVDQRLQKELQSYGSLSNYHSWESSYQTYQRSVDLWAEKMKQLFPYASSLESWPFMPMSKAGKGDVGKITKNWFSSPQWAPLKSDPDLNFARKVQAQLDAYWNKSLIDTVYNFDQRASAIEDNPLVMPLESVRKLSVINDFDKVSRVLVTTKCVADMPMGGGGDSSSWDDYGIRTQGWLKTFRFLLLEFDMSDISSLMKTGYTNLKEMDGAATVIAKCYKNWKRRKLLDRGRK